MILTVVSCSKMINQTTIIDVSYRNFFFIQKEHFSDKKMFVHVLEMYRLFEVYMCVRNLVPSSQPHRTPSQKRKRNEQSRQKITLLPKKCKPSATGISPKVFRLKKTISSHNFLSHFKHSIEIH